MEANTQETKQTTEPAKETTQDTKALTIEVTVDGTYRILCWKPNPTFWSDNKEEFRAKWQNTENANFIIKDKNRSEEELKAIPIEEWTLWDWIWMACWEFDGRVDEAIDEAGGEEQYWQTLPQSTIEQRKTFTQTHPRHGIIFVYDYCDHDASSIYEHIDWVVKVLPWKTDHDIFLTDDDETIGYLHNGGGIFEFPESDVEDMFEDEGDVEEDEEDEEEEETEDAGAEEQQGTK